MQHLHDHRVTMRHRVAAVIALLTCVAAPAFIGAVVAGNAERYSDSGPTAIYWMFAGWTLVALMVPLPLIAEVAGANRRRELATGTLAVGLLLAVAHTVLIVVAVQALR